MTAVGGPVNYSVSAGPALLGAVSVTVTSLLAVSAEVTVDPGNHPVLVALGL